MRETFEHLFSPLALGPAVLPNRIVSTARRSPRSLEEAILEGTLAARLLIGSARL